MKRLGHPAEEGFDVVGDRCGKREDQPGRDNDDRHPDQVLVSRYGLAVTHNACQPLFPGFFPLIEQKPELKRDHHDHGGQDQRGKRGKAQVRDGPNGGEVKRTDQDTGEQMQGDGLGECVLSYAVCLIGEGYVVHHA